MQGNKCNGAGKVVFLRLIKLFYSHTLNYVLSLIDMRMLIRVTLFINSIRNTGVNMGSSISSALEQAKDDDAILEQLQTLDKMMVNKIAAESIQMKDDALQDKTLPIVAIVDTSEKCSVKVESHAADEVKDAVGAMLSGNFLAGLEDLITVALNELLGDTTAGEKFKKDFHVVFANNGLLRVDLMLYKYDFSSQGLVDKVQNGFCYYSQIGVLDLKKVNPQVLLYELTRAVGQENLQAATTELEGVATLAERLYKVIDQLDQAAKDDSGKSAEREDESEDSGNTSIRMMMKSLRAADQ